MHTAADSFSLLQETFLFYVHLRGKEEMKEMNVMVIIYVHPVSYFYLLTFI